MIYPTLGISIVVHAIIVGAAKAKNFLGFGETSESEEKKSITGKIFLALFIAVIIESVLFFVAGSSLAAVYLGVTSSNSNFKIIENAIYRFENKTAFPDATIILSFKN